MLSTQCGANLKADLEKSETWSVQTWFWLQFPTSQSYFFLDSLGGGAKKPPKHLKHIWLIAALVFTEPHVVSIEAKNLSLTHWWMMRCRHPPFKDKYWRPGLVGKPCDKGRHGMEWLSRNTKRTTHTLWHYGILSYATSEFLYLYSRP